MIVSDGELTHTQTITLAVNDIVEEAPVLTSFMTFA